MTNRNTRPRATKPTKTDSADAALVGMLAEERGKVAALEAELALVRADLADAVKVFQMIGGALQQFSALQQQRRGVGPGPSTPDADKAKDAG